MVDEAEIEAVLDLVPGQKVTIQRSAAVPTTTAEEFLETHRLPERLEQHVAPILLQATDFAIFDPAPGLEAQIEKNLVTALLSRGPFQLTGLKSSRPFSGHGVYALFYQGPLDAYTTLCSPSSSYPIYVGKSIQKGRRKGAQDDVPYAVFHRLSEHVRSVRQTTNLDPKDFTFRFVLLAPQWVPLAEHYLIRFFQPLWNVGLDGFGNHATGQVRQSQLASEWDTYHPGRPGMASTPRSLPEVQAKLEHWILRCTHRAHEIQSSIK